MEITKTSLGTVFNHSTVKYESIAILLTFENDGEMDVVALNVHYIDTDGNKVLTYFTCDENHGISYYLDTVSVDTCDYLNKKIIDHSSCISKKFEVTDELCEYIDKVVDETMEKHKIIEE